MKKLALISIFLLLTSGWAIEAVANQTPSYSNGKVEGEPEKTDYPGGIIKVAVWTTSDMIYLQFLETVGTVDVKLLNQQGHVQSETSVNTNKQTQLSIVNPMGECTIDIVDKNGHSVSIEITN